MNFCPGTILNTGDVVGMCYSNEQYGYQWSPGEQKYLHKRLWLGGKKMATISCVTCDETTTEYLYCHHCFRSACFGCWDAWSTRTRYHFSRHSVRVCRRCSDGLPPKTGSAVAPLGKCPVGPFFQTIYNKQRYGPLLSAIAYYWLRGLVYGKGFLAPKGLTESDIFQLKRHRVVEGARLLEVLARPFAPPTYDFGKHQRDIERFRRWLSWENAWW